MDALKWVVWLTPLEPAAGSNGPKLLDLPPHAIVRMTGNRQMAGTPAMPWSEVEYLGQNMQSHVGWVYDGYLEDYTPNRGDVVHIDPSLKLVYPYAPVQDLTFNGMTQFNLCAEFCSAYIGGEPILDFLNKCKANSSLSFAITNKAIGVTQLQLLLTTMYGYSSTDIKAFADGLRDPVMGVQITSGRVANMLKSFYLVALVHINSAGEIVYYDPTKQGTPDMVLHWVVIEEVDPFGYDDGEVTLFNPFPDNMEKIAFRLLYQSMAPGPTGLWVPRVKTSSGVGSATH
ncbi:MAG TPA: hypothetical protein VMT73_04640 [Anaerolineales bacterium]|nr:hypothetical protein [Anaerolineales bacterium]